MDVNAKISTDLNMSAMRQDVRRGARPPPPSSNLRVIEGFSFLHSVVNAHRHFVRFKCLKRVMHCLDLESIVYYSFFTIMMLAGGVGCMYNVEACTLQQSLGRAKKIYS